MKNFKLIVGIGLLVIIALVASVVGWNRFDGEYFHADSG